jgi:phosphoribosylformimino-5-aminoimidazole carboxamide ribotide isomerase
MQIVPVMDLLRGDVVRGIAGRRESYRPIQSQLARDARPASVAAAFASLGLTVCYVADLDAIAGGKPDWDAYRSIMQSGLKAWIDAGCGDERRADQLAEFKHGGKCVHRVVVGLESLPTPAALPRIIATAGAERVIFSLDLKQGGPIMQEHAWSRLGALEVADEIVAAGVKRMLILDLAAVGAYGGPATLSLCTALRNKYASLEIISGGGVRGGDDLAAFASAGCDYVLVASALHDGRIALGEASEVRQTSGLRAIRPEM